MEPEGSILCSQEPPTCPYHEPDQSPTPPTSSTLIYIRPILLLSSQLHLGLLR